VYSRESGDQTFTFEPSGGLLNASLVMMDKETDSYWSIINDLAIHGPSKGKYLVQVPGSVKTTFGEWKKSHPDTWVLSVGGREHDARSPYDSYFSSKRGFRNTAAQDKRLDDKALLFSFHYQDAPYAVPFDVFEKGGGVVALAAGQQLFLYREKDDSFYRSTVAFLAPAGAVFVHRKGAWLLVRDGATVASFDPETRSFGDAAEPFVGFDTFWYIWSLTNKDTKLLKG